MKTEFFLFQHELTQINHHFVHCI